jgi:hypothetical protein
MMSEFRCPYCSRIVRRESDSESQIVTAWCVNAGRMVLLKRIEAPVGIDVATGPTTSNDCTTK